MRKYTLTKNNPLQEKENCLWLRPAYKHCGVTQQEGFLEWWVCLIQSDYVI